MRLAIISGALLAAGCAGTPTADKSQPADRVCGVDDCFYQRDVRNFEVIEHTTLIVYVGKERCPYQIELRGTFCDLAFTPDIAFVGPRELIHNSEQNTFGTSPSDTLRDLRICRNDLNVGVTGGGALAENPTNAEQRGPFGTPRTDCMISSVAALTDDELIELYVRRGGVAPPPPMGPGKIQVGDQNGGDRASEAQADTQPNPAAQQAAPTSHAEDAATAATGAR